MNWISITKNLNINIKVLCDTYPVHYRQLVTLLSVHPEGNIKVLCDTYPVHYRQLVTLLSVHPEANFKVLCDTYPVHPSGCTDSKVTSCL
jgi:hypothetical protein